MITGLLIIYLVVVLLMVGAILIQKSEGGGLVSSNTGGLVSNRGAKNFLTRFTAILATLFFTLSIILAILFRSDSGSNNSILDGPGREVSAPAAEKAEEPKPTEPAAPVAE